MKTEFGKTQQQESRGCDISLVKEKMEKAIDNMSSQLRGLHSSNISAGLVDTIKVEYHNQQTPIRQLAQTADTPQGISIQPYEKEICGKIITALKHAGYDAYLFSKLAVMVNRPKPSGEDKTKVKQQIAKLGEEAKILIRNILQSFRKSLSGSEDEIRNSEKLAQHYADHACKMVDEKVGDRCSKL